MASMAINLLLAKTKSKKFWSEWGNIISKMNSIAPAAGILLAEKKQCTHSFACGRSEQTFNGLYQQQRYYNAYG